jgi:hypothetical protein
VPQTAYARGYGYESPPSLVIRLLHRSTWDLFRPDCRRHVYPNVIDLIERHGDSLKSAALWGRARCRDCGARMKMAGGMSVPQLQEIGELQRLTLAGGGALRRALASAGRPMF